MGKDGPRINDEITAREVRLIGEGTDTWGVVSLMEAFKIAQEKSLDLVEVSPNAAPPVVKLIDFGKFKYQQQKKLSEAKKKQIVIAIKEIQFRPNIEKHDLETKLKKAEKFLEVGDKVKMIMQFRGREMAYTKMGLEKFQTIVDTVVAYGGVLESEPKMMGNRVMALVASTRKKVK